MDARKQVEDRVAAQLFHKPQYVREAAVDRLLYYAGEAGVAIETLAALLADGMTINDVTQRIFDRIRASVQAELRAGSGK